MSKPASPARASFASISCTTSLVSQSALAKVPVAVVSRPGLGYGDARGGTAPGRPASELAEGTVYDAVEAVFRQLGFDLARAGTPDWNPLSELIQPGDRVVIKPNFVTNKNFHERLSGDYLACSSTPAAVLRPIIDYALRAAGPRGRVLVVDTPVEGCNLEEVLRALGVRDLLAEYRARGCDVAFYDLRHFCIVPRMLLDNVQAGGRSLNLGLLLRQALPGDPLGYAVVDLGERSHFAAVPQRSPRLAFHRAHLHTPVPHHSAGRHEYSLPRTVLQADAVITVAKLKTHKKSGVTLSLKSAIGLCNEKYWLPHYTLGTVAEGGDEFPIRPPLAARLRNQLQRVSLPPPLAEHSLVARAPRRQGAKNGSLDGYIVEGSWEGNDTIWRTTLDLCQLVHYVDREGRLRDQPQRRHLALIDGILGGEGEGPLAATPKPAGLLIAGTDPALVDHVAAQAMGYDPERIPTLRQALRQPLLPTSELRRLELRWDGPRQALHFAPPSTWPSLRR